jgi:hypothetical protein
MMCKFTSDEAFEAQAEGDPIMISRAAALKILRDHSVSEDSHEAFYREVEEHGDGFDAADVLMWLGY